MHDVSGDEEESFRRLLKSLSHDHIFISYTEAVERILNGNIDRPYVVISFDDGLKRCLQIAQIMNEFGVKGCFFVCPPMIGETDERKIKEFCSQKLHIQPSAFLSWDEIEALLKQGHEIGSHTMTHSNLGNMPVQQMQDEIAGSFHALSQRIGHVEHFAWPFGHFFQFNPIAARIVFETGFRTCASAERGCHVAQTQDPTRLCIRRDNTVANWPLNHIRYFMAKNSRTASIQTNQWPEGWLEAI
jgi:peptidoglycan/xylan/chitin deacetylase (PgdA/CDA1 family)